MNKLALTFALFILLIAGVAGVSAQDDELGGLPPLPDLDLGDPERKLSWKEKRKMNRAAVDSRYDDNVYTRSSSDVGAATVGQRLKSSTQRKSTTGARPTEINVNNSMSSPDNAVTASGSRLLPFGQEEDHWAGLPDVIPDEELIELPPMPDYRTPDQVTRRERMRNLRVAKYEARKAEADAKRQMKEQEQRATVNRPAPDPSTALVQVQSQGSGQPLYMGNEAAPETVGNGTLKPFNDGSSYYRDNQKVYQGNKPESPVKFWWQRGTSEPGGGDAEAPRFSWRNPLKTASDDVQTISYASTAQPSGFSSSSSALEATPLTSNLRGIRVVKATRDVSGSVSGVSGVVSEGVDLPPKVLAELESRIGSDLTLGSLNQMVRDAVLAYRRSDLPVVDVLVPEQEITSGVLQLVIIEGRLGDVLVEGTSQREGQSLARQIRTERGEVIRESRLTEDLAWINKHPTRQVDLIFSPGTNYGETDVILRSETYRALSAYIAYENSGTAALGESRAIFGASWTGPLFTGMDSILSYQFTTNFDSSDSNLYGHSGVFATYLPWRHQLTLLGAHVDSNAAVQGGIGSSGGVNRQGSLRYGIPLPNIGRMTHELELGMDFKSSNSDFDFNNVRIFDTTSEIVQYSLGYNIVAKDSSGTWRVDSEFVSSPGDNTSKNTDIIFDSQRAGASANYTYGRVLIERDQQIGESGWSVLGRLQAQAANSNLLASETLGAGGYDTVRGFEQRIVRGDNGVVGTVELRTPTLYPSTMTGFTNIQDGAYGLLFYDAGALSSEIPLPGEPDFRLGSVGFGFRYQKEEWFTLRVDYGFQVTEDGFDDGEQGRWHVGARATF